MTPSSSGEKLDKPSPFWYRHIITHGYSEQLRLNQELAILNKKAIKNLSLDGWLGYTKRRDAMLNSPCSMYEVVSKLREILVREILLGG